MYCSGSSVPTMGTDVNDHKMIGDVDEQGISYDKMGPNSNDPVNSIVSILE